MNREDKLAKLNQKKQASEMVILTNGTPFVEAFISVVDDFKKTVGLGVDINAEELVEQLSKIESFVPALEEVAQAVAKVHFPDVNVNVPDTIELNGLETATNEIKQAIELLHEIKKQKAPDITVQVESISKTNVSEISKSLDTNIKKLLLTTNKQYEDIQKTVLEKLDAIVKTINKNIVKKEVQQGQNASEFTPVRRVRAIGNKLVFDDDAWGGSSGGGVLEVGSPSFATNQTVVSTSATLLIEARNGRRGVLITNLSTKDVWIGNDTVTNSTGALLLGTRGTALFVPTQSAIYAIVDSATATVGIMETY